MTDGRRPSNGTAEPRDRYRIEMLTARQIIECLNLHPLAFEGGYVRETYRSSLTIPADALTAEYGGTRHVSTAIYYLLTPDTFSAIHRVKSDEVFHFYSGDAVEMLQLWPDGTGTTLTIGNDLAAGLEPQVIVPAGIWQGCRLEHGGKWALMAALSRPDLNTPITRPAIVKSLPQPIRSLPR